MLAWPRWTIKSSRLPTTPRKVPFYQIVRFFEKRATNNGIGKFGGALVTQAGRPFWLDMQFWCDAMQLSAALLEMIETETS